MVVNKFNKRKNIETIQINNNQLSLINSGDNNTDIIKDILNTILDKIFNTIFNNHENTDINMVSPQITLEYHNTNLNLDNKNNTNNVDNLDNIDIIDNVDNLDNKNNTDNVDNIDNFNYDDKIAKYHDEINSFFDLTSQMIENMNLKRKKQRDLLQFNFLTKQTFIDNMVDDNNKLCIKITDELINNASLILQQLPKSIIDSIIHYDNNTIDISDKPKKEFKLISENIFNTKDKIQIKGNTRVLILRNIFKNIQKLYFNFFDFINDNLELFKQSVILDNPILDI